MLFTNLQYRIIMKKRVLFAKPIYLVILRCYLTSRLFINSLNCSFRIEYQTVFVFIMWIWVNDETTQKWGSEDVCLDENSTKYSFAIFKFQSRYYRESTSQITVATSYFDELYLRRKWFDYRAYYLNSLSLWKLNFLFNTRFITFVIPTLKRSL